MGLKYVLIDMWANDQNEMMFSTSNRKIIYLTMLIVCRKNLTQSDHMDCKIITIEGEGKKSFLVVSHGCFQCFEIQ
jgi:hypothetical protein